MLESGVVLSGRYRLEERIATGGMGEVWRATDTVLGRRVAVKVLLPNLLSDPDFIARFRAEARMMAVLHHPGIVQVYDCGEDTLADGGRADYLVMEYVDGEPLSERIRRDGRFGVAETLELVAQAATALHAAHTAGIVHRDVKPSNLLVQPDGSVMLVDFGVARSLNMTSITSTNAVPGTALYMAPEQAAGRPVSGATDIYALGAVAYHCVAGHPPFTAENALQVAVRHLHDDLPALPGEVPAQAAAVIYQALAKEPTDRFTDAAAFADAARRVRIEPAPGGAEKSLVASTDGTTGGPDTLSDNPVVAVVGPDTPRGRRGRAAAVLGVTAGLLIAGGLAATLAFQPMDTDGATNDPAPAVETTAPAVPPTSTGGVDQPGPGSTGESPDRSGRSTGPTRSASPDPSGNPDPTPSTSAEPEIPATSPPTTSEPTLPVPSGGSSPTANPVRTGD